MAIFSKLKRLVSFGKQSSTQDQVFADQIDVTTSARVIEPTASVLTDLDGNATPAPLDLGASQPAGECAIVDATADQIAFEAFLNLELTPEVASAAMELVEPVATDDVPSDAPVNAVEAAIEVACEPTIEAAVEPSLAVTVLDTIVAAPASDAELGFPVALPVGEIIADVVAEPAPATDITPEIATAEATAPAVLEAALEPIAEPVAEAAQVIVEMKPEQAPAARADVSPATLTAAAPSPSRDAVVDDLLMALLADARKRADEAVGAYDTLSRSAAEYAKRSRRTARTAWSVVGTLAATIVCGGISATYELTRAWGESDVLRERVASNETAANRANTVAASERAGLQRELAIANRTHAEAVAQVEAELRSADEAKLRAEIDVKIARQARAKAEDELKIWQRQLGTEARLDETRSDAARPSAAVIPASNPPASRSRIAPQSLPIPGAAAEPTTRPTDSKADLSKSETRPTGDAWARLLDGH